MSRAHDPLDDLRRRAFAPGGLTVAGCLSGTSVDGIDVVLARGALDGRGALAAPLEVLDARTRPFEGALADRVHRAIAAEPHTPGELALLDRDLARAFAEAVAEARASAGVPLDLVASHGQTVWHHDGAADGGPWTLQLGDGDQLAELAGVPVASDFRRADVAAGGEGAPLVPLVDGELFARLPRPAAVLNLGGIANLTLLDDGPPRGFDVGPANVWLDGFARALLGRAFDAGGRTAAEGRVDEELLARWTSEPFYRRRPPKSTGRDTFDPAWVARRLAEGEGRPPRDLLATAVAAVAWSVGDAVARFVRPAPARLVVAGGGAHHGPLLEALAERTGLRVERSEVHGVPGDHREALAFALLGLRAVAGVPSEGGSVTGAGGPRVLGKLSRGRPGGLATRTGLLAADLDARPRPDFN